MTLLISREVEARLKALAEQKEQSVEDLLIDWLQYIEDESDAAEWEARVMAEALGDALRADGTIDFAALETKSVVMSLEELCADGEEHDEA